MVFEPFDGFCKLSVASGSFQWLLGAFSGILEFSVATRKKKFQSLLTYKFEIDLVIYRALIIPKCSTVEFFVNFPELL